MPWGLKRYQQARCLHFVTFSCYHRAPLLGTLTARDGFEHTLEQTHWYGFYNCGYVVMPEHVHLLVREPERGRLCTAIQMLKQNVARTLPRPAANRPFWQTRYYDFNAWSEKKRIEKLRYMHRNPVKRGLVQRPGDWRWSSFRHYVSGCEGVVEIESQWTDRKRENTGVIFQPFAHGQRPHPVSAKSAETRMGHPRFYQPDLTEE